MFVSRCQNLTFFIDSLEIHSHLFPIQLIFSLKNQSYFAILNALGYLPINGAPVAQLDRASDYESEGRRFESYRALHFLPLFLHPNQQFTDCL